MFLLCRDRLFLPALPFSIKGQGPKERAPFTCVCVQLSRCLRKGGPIHSFACGDISSDLLLLLNGATIHLTHHQEDLVLEEPQRPICSSIGSNSSRRDSEECQEEEEEAITHTHTNFGRLK